MNFFKINLKVQLFLVISIFALQLKSQVTLTDSMSNVRVCFLPEENKLTFNVVSGTTGSYAEVEMPTGFTFEGFVNGSNTNGGTVTYAGLFSGFHRFSISNTTGGATIVVRFKQFARCGAGISSFTTSNNVRFFNGTATTNFTTSSFNGTAPSLSITGISNTPSSLVAVGTTVTRKYTVTNGGFGPTTDFLIVDKSNTGQVTINTSSFVINPSGSNYSIPAASVSTSGDSTKVTFLNTLISASGIGDGDTIFENNESFELQYTLVTSTCGVPTITSQLLASWRCPGNARCDWFAVNTGLSTTGPALPNIVQLATLKRRNDCFDGLTVWRDTLVIHNNSTGAATDLVINAGGTRTTSFRADLAGAYFDTATFRVRIGKNGIVFKPAYTLISTLNGNNYAPCNFLGRPNQIEFTIPLLAGGDTMYIIMGQVQCNYEKTCIVNQASSQYNYFNGLGINFIYKNACGNATLNGGWMDARSYRDHYYDINNTGPLSLSDGQTGDLSLEIGQINHNAPERLIFSDRAYREVTVIRPNVIIYDPAYARPVYFTNGADSLLPYYRSANGDTFKFRIDNGFYSLPTIFHAKVKGLCDGATCSGILQYKIIFSHNPDTTYCTRENPEFCLDYPIAWASSCIVCCPKGMVNLKYAVDRTNYGLGDTDNNGLPNGTINKSLINTKRTIPGDTVEILHKFYFKTDTVDIKWDYARSLMKVSAITDFSIISDSVFVDRLVGTDSTFATTATTLGVDKFNTDISFMSSFLQGDTVTIKLKLRVLSNVVADVVSFNSPVDGSASNDNFVTNFGCGSIIDKLEMYGVDAFGYIAHNSAVNGCQDFDFYPVFYNRIGPGQGTYSNFRFPFEYRPLAQPQRMKIKIPTGYTVSSLVTWNTNYANQPLSSTYPQFTSIPFTLVNDTIFYDVRNLFTNNGGLITTADEGGWIQFRVRLQPTCKTPNGFNGQFAQLDSFIMIPPLTSSAYNMGVPNPQLGSTLQNFHPNIILSSNTPISVAYTKNVDWPLSVNNLTTFAATNNWLYIVKPSGLTTIDSVKEGATLITPDANGFYRYGNIIADGTRNFTIYGKSTSCVFDSILVYPGWACSGVYPTSFSLATCSRPPIALYVQPQPAAIQTQITPLITTPIDPSDGASAGWGSSDIYSCLGFPLEMEIQSTQPGTIFNVKENAILPLNAGNVQVDLIQDSIYIEYPIGTTPRLASFIGRALMQSTVATGSMVLDLEKLDSINFSPTKGLPGTGLGTATTRRVKIRWKMKTNCDIISGAQWNARQKANAPCGSPAQGDNTITSGFPLDIKGIIKPYSLITSLTPKVGGCSSGNCDTTILRLQKIGAGVTVGDSVFIKLPLNVTLGSITCEGVNCPGNVSGVIPASSIVIKTTVTERFYRFAVPTEFDNNTDSLLFKIQAFDNNKASCVSGSTMEAGVSIPVTLTCLGSPCPASNASLGSGSGSFDVNKPIITFSSYTGLSYAPYTGPNFTYSYTLDVKNTGLIKTNTNMVFKTFFDKNVNGTYEPLLDSLADTYAYPSSILPDSTSTINRTFTGVTFPSQYRPMFTIIDTAGTNNCMCAPIVQSQMFVGLPINILEFNSNPIKCTNAITWKAQSNNSSTTFILQKSVDGKKWFDMYTVKTQLNNNLQSYSYTDLVPNTVSYYRIKQVALTGVINYSKAIYANSACINLANVISLQPNPIQSGNLQVSILSSDIETIQVNIIDISGKIVFTKMVSIIEGNNQVLIPFDNFTAGVYTLQTKVNNVAQNSKIVKVN